MAKLANDIFKTVKGLGYVIEMYDYKGQGPIVDPEKAKYIYLKPDQIMISIPRDDSNDIGEVFIYTSGDSLNDKNKKMIQRIKNIGMQYQTGVTIRKFDKKDITPKKFAYKGKIEKDYEKGITENTLIKEIIDLLKK